MGWFRCEQLPLHHPFICRETPIVVYCRAQSPGYLCKMLVPTIRGHATLTHLHPVFRKSVPPEAGASLRYIVLLWLARHLLEEGATLEDLARDVPTDEIFQEHAAGIPQDLNRAMYALCQFVGEDQSRRFSLFGRLHPALLLHWRVHADLVSRWGPGLWRDYRELWAQEMVGGHPALTFGTPPILGSISLEEPTGQEENEGAQTPPESLCPEVPEDWEDDERAPTPPEEEQVGAM